MTGYRATNSTIVPINGAIVPIKVLSCQWRLIEESAGEAVHRHCLHSLERARHLKVPIRVKFEWREKEGAIRPGKVAIIEWSPPNRQSPDAINAKLLSGEKQFGCRRPRSVCALVSQ